MRMAPISRLVTWPRRQIIGSIQRGSALRLLPSAMRNQAESSKPARRWRGAGGLAPRGRHDGLGRAFGQERACEGEILLGRLGLGPEPLQEPGLVALPDVVG